MDCPWVYGFQSGEFIKIGSAGNVERRLKQFQLGNPHPLKVVMRRNVEEAVWLERRIHRLLASHAVGREWFRVDVAQAKAMMLVAVEDLAVMRREQIAREMKHDDCPDLAKLALWNGRGVRRPHPATL